MSEQFLIQVDPRRIKFNPHNPRKHHGLEYVRLKESIQQIGIIQPPIVRVLPGGFYEVIDGEGRVSVAQELGVETIWVISVGIVSDHEALVMLQASNSLRSFHFLAECKGLANLHREGMSLSKLAKHFGCGHTKIRVMVAVGYLPARMLAQVEEHIASSESRAGVWTYSMFEQILLLREVLPGKDPSAAEEGSLDGVYDYREVGKAVDLVIAGKFENSEQMRTYVVNRRYEIYQARFNQELQRRLERELAATRAALEEAEKQRVHELELESEQRIHEEKEQARIKYEGKITLLEAQLASLKKRHEETVREVARRPESIETRELELDKELAETQRLRQELEDLRQQRLREAAQAEEEARKRREQEERALRERLAQEEEEARKRREQWEKEQRQQFELKLAAQQEARERKLKELEGDLKKQAEEEKQKYKFEAEMTISGLLAQGVGQLADAQRLLDHIISSSMIDGVRALGGTGYENLLVAIRSMRQTLDRAEKKLTHAGVIQVEGGLVNGHTQSGGESL
jgi:hypothetical protein